MFVVLLFRWLKREEIEAQDDQAQMLDPGPKLDLGFKEGQTITINLGVCSHSFLADLNYSCSEYIWISSSCL